MISCPHLHGELEGVLVRDRFLRWRTREDLDRYVADLRVIAFQGPAPLDVPSVTRDPRDDYLVALAQAAQHAVLFSGDGDLGDVEAAGFMGPSSLVTPVDETAT